MSRVEDKILRGSVASAKTRAPAERPVNHKAVFERTAQNTATFKILDSPLDSHEGSLSPGAVPDPTDFRDRTYMPTLRPAMEQMPPPADLAILDQKQGGACVGFALAATLNFLGRRQGASELVSPRMLYEVAKRFDEDSGDGYQGSSCRSAIKGLFNMGVCSTRDWPYVPGKPGRLNPGRAKKARNVSVVGYFRLGGSVSDFHCALNETGVIFVSAQLHSGWLAKNLLNGSIRYDGSQGSDHGHAFAIVGYDADGFFVQNSWGENWGERGIAHWSYADWQANIWDAWVLQLARTTAQIFPGQARSRTLRAKRSDAPAPRRNEIMGHFTHFADGCLQARGKYYSHMEDILDTADLVAGSDHYDHLMFYIHGESSSPEQAAERISAMRDVFKANRIYPYHIIWDTGLLKELQGALVERRQDVDERACGEAEVSDCAIERILRPLGRAVWREIKRDPLLPFQPRGDGARMMAAFLDRLAKARIKKKVHMVAHGAGSIFLGHMLQSAMEHRSQLKIQTVTLMAPASTCDEYQAYYLPHIGRLEDLAVINLSKKLELADSVAGLYGKSLLYLVSRAFEDQPGIPLLGLVEAAYEQNDFDLIVSLGDHRRSPLSAAKHHGGFDDDPATMNHVLKRILERKPKTTFDKDILCKH